MAEATGNQDLQESSGAGQQSDVHLLTAQRSIEDEEEVAREQRRRAREEQRSLSNYHDSSPDGTDITSPREDNQYDDDFKPSLQSALDEDEGFSDWTQRLEQHRQQRLEDVQQDEDELLMSSRRPWGTQEGEEQHQRMETSRRISQRAEVDGEQLEVAQGSRMRKEGARVTSEMANWSEETGSGATREAFLQRDVQCKQSNGSAAQEEVEEHEPSSRRTLRHLSLSEEDDQEAMSEAEAKLEKIRRSLEEKESQEYERLRQKQAEAEMELEELQKRREERRRLREEEERRRQLEELERQEKEEEERKRMKQDIERRRKEATEKRLKNLSISSCEGEEVFCPLSPRSPTFKSEADERVTAETTYTITERTESLNRSLKKSNSVKKMQPPVPISKIDDRKDQYTHAVETSLKEAKPDKQPLMDIPHGTEPVSSMKSLWEGSEPGSHAGAKVTPCKETEGLKVGVADLITQWVKGNPDCSSKSSPSKPAEIKAGDVLSKKNIWELKGDSSPSQASSVSKSTPSGKRYKFIVTGHGKYEKVPVSDDQSMSYANGKSAGEPREDS
ncbi:non-muscle caldesmon isoform X1 [Polypterus senegalus]|uniref:non-muscle caldesmon isoform X1 n=1 Tax=Polypterus senegalus TaxID=55291 RepID=UPI001962B880|nr:non-muscle caldesmon isoform X1 [Polypterus senegalus]